MGQNLSQSKFLERAKRKHGNCYDYSKTVYINIRTPILITCKVHGDFTQIPNDHANGRGCKECGRIRSINYNTRSQEDFIGDVKRIHKDFYDYSKTLYEHCEKNILIICPIHGEFWQKASNHLRGCGCKKCVHTKKVERQRQQSQTDFEKKAKLIHGNKYDYNQILYRHSQTKVKIICKEHGEFLQTPAAHLANAGCPDCGRKIRIDAIKLTQEEFENKARQVHGDRYDYSNAIYVTSSVKVRINCKKHGEFLQTPSHHLFGTNCPVCSRNRGLRYFVITEKFKPFGVSFQDRVIWDCRTLLFEKIRKDAQHYIYAYLDDRFLGKYSYHDERTNLEFIFSARPFYVGMGTGDRELSHLKKSSLKGHTTKNDTIKEIQLEIGQNPTIIRVKSNLTWSTANRYEVVAIGTIGRADLDHGPLCNLTDGGQGHRNKHNKKIAKSVIDENGNRYESQRIAAIELGDTPQNICYMLSGRIPNKYGLKRN